MKKLKTKLLGAGVVGAFVVVTGTSALAQVAQPSPPPAYGTYPNYYYEPPHDLGFHFGADLGPAIMQDFNSSKFGFPGHFSPRVGERFCVAPGFDFFSAGGLSIGADFETGFIYNDIHNIQSSGQGTDLHVDNYQVPILGDLVFKFHPNSWVTPFIGVGGGGDYFHGVVRQYGFFGDWYSDDQINPAVQAMAGVRFRMNSAIDFGLSYKYLAAFPDGNAAIATHAVLASVSFKF